MKRELVIDAVADQGDGVSRGQEGQGGAVFAALTLPGERVLAEVHGERAETIQIVAASADRIAPACPHFGACGGCALQHWRAAPYLEWKRRQVVAALERVGIAVHVEPTFAPAANSRRRLALHARRQDGSVRLGFKARRSWRVEPIETCVIAHPRLVAALPALRALAEPFLEHARSAPTFHVSWTQTGLDIEVSGVEARSGGLSADGRIAAARLAALADVARLTLSGETLYQARTPLVRFGKALVAPPPGAFLQASAEAEEALVGFVAQAVEKRGRVIDLFCGVGTFSLRLAERASVEAYDASATAVSALAAAHGSTEGLRPIRAITRDLERRPLSPKELAGSQAVLFDPPRAGAAAQARQIAASRVERVVAVSCNPVSFARDARQLIDGGYRLDRVLPVDQFVWSPHIELAASFSRVDRRR